MCSRLVEIDIGKRSPAVPVTPPRVQVRTRRFGRLSYHPNHQAGLEDRDDIAYLTYFNAGLRVYDTRDARQPKEFAYFVSADPSVRIGTKPSQANWLPNPKTCSSTGVAVFI
jgi:hypothetical protein